MKKIVIVTDSNSGISQKQALELGIKVIPMPFFANGEVYYEDISLTQEGFYDLLAKDVNISTSQPSIGEVTELWDNLLNEYDEIVQIPMSSGLSMSCNTAKIFASEKPYEGRVHIVDNMRISITQRQAVLDAINLAKENKSGLEIKEILEKDALNSTIYILVDTLKYLKKGGRVTAAGAALGALLGIKPVLTIQGAKLDAFKKTRGIKAAKQVMLDALNDDINNRFGGDLSNVHLGVAHTNNLFEAEKFLEEVKTKFPNAKSYYLDSLSLSVSCHIGPSSLAVTACKDLKTNG